MNPVRSLFFILMLLAWHEAEAQDTRKGVMKESFPEGKVGYGHLKRGAKTGRWCVYNSAGKLTETINYHKGKKEGADTLFYANGKVDQIDQYVEGMRNGVSIQYNFLGDTLKVEHYLNDSLNGDFLEYYNWKKQRQTGQYVMGKREGWWITTGVNQGITDSVIYVNGQRNGTCTRFMDGRHWIVTQYVNGKKNGTEIQYGSDGITPLSIISYSKDKREGRFNYFNKNGARVESGWFCNDLSCRYDSIWGTDGKGGLQRVILLSQPGKIFTEEVWDPAVNASSSGKGLVCRMYYGDDGLMDSILTYDANGKTASRGVNDVESLTRRGRENTYSLQEFDSRNRVTAEGQMEFSMRERVWTFYDTLGRVTEKIEYKSGVANGSFTSYYPNGKVRIQGLCSRGFLHDSIVVYSPAGKIVKEDSQQWRRIIFDVLQPIKDVHFKDPSSPIEGEPPTNMTGDGDDDD